MPLSLVSILPFAWLLSASLACISRPAIVAATWPPALSAFTPHNLTVVVSAPLLRPRFQVLSTPPQNLFPVSTTPTSSGTVALLFRLPALPPSRPQWQLRIFHNNSDSFLTHPSNRRLNIRLPPLIRSIHPRVLHPFRTSLILLTGNFPPDPRIFIANRRIPPRRIPSISPTEIIVRVSPSFSVSQLSIFVLAVDGVSSPIFNISVRRDLIPISLAPLHASYQYSAAHYILSSLCTNSTAVVHFQAHTLPNPQVPVFNVSYRTSAMSPASFRRLQTFSSSTVLALPHHIFSESHQSDRVVTVVITCAHAGRIGQTILFISQRTSAQVFGISVFPHVHQMVPLQSTAVLRASFSSIYCPKTADTSVQLIWRVNNTIVHPLQNTSKSLHAIVRPVTTGLGNTLIVPTEGRFVYVVQAVLQHTVTRRVIARAAATGVAVVRKNFPSFQAVLNGASTAITLPPEIKDYPIRVDVYEQSQYGALLVSPARFMFQWSCTMVLDDVTSPCTSQLFSPWLATESSTTSNFQISTVGVEAGTRVEYSVLVYNELSATQRLNLTLNIAVQENTLVFPSDAKLGSASTYPSRRVINEGPVFECFESIILSWNQKISEPLDFKLFREGQLTDILSNGTEGLIVPYDGYWTRERRFGRFFAVSASILGAGRFVLHGAVNRTAGPGVGMSWRFSVEGCATLILSNLPITDGTANVTVFHAAAYSLPSSDKLYAFMLRPESPNMDEASISSDGRQNVAFDLSACLDGCTGKPAVSFTVRRAGRYRIAVKMYDPSGMYLLGSETSNSTIIVTDSDDIDAQTLGGSVAEFLNSSVLHRDESRFFDFLQSIQNGTTSLETSVVDLVTATLKLVVFSPAVNALQCTQYVEACGRVLGLEALNVSALESTLTIIDAAVQQSVSSGSVGFHLRQALKDFYGSATEMVHKMAQGGDSRDAESGDEIKEMADRTRNSAALSIPMVLSAGRACGVVDSERVYLKGTVGLKDGGGAGTVEAFDEYRIGVSCFAGQIKKLGPEPATVHTCGEERGLIRGEDEEMYVLSSVEQHNVLETEVGASTLAGPQMNARLYKRVKQRGNMHLVKISESCCGCYRTRVSVYATQAVSETFSLVGDGKRVTCRGGGTVTEWTRHQQRDGGAPGAAAGAHPPRAQRVRGAHRRQGGGEHSAERAAGGAGGQHGIRAQRGVPTIAARHVPRHLTGAQHGARDGDAVATARAVALLHQPVRVGLPAGAAGRRAATAGRICAAAAQLSDVGAAQCERATTATAAAHATLGPCAGGRDADGRGAAGRDAADTARGAAPRRRRGGGRAAAALCDGRGVDGGVAAHV
ncbi:unnamed protein product [Agarophyton chilense]